MNEITVVNEKFETGIKTMEVQVGQAIAAIRDEKSCDIASDLARECANMVDQIEAELGPNVRDAKGTYERLRDKVSGYKAPYVTWRAKISGAVAAWRFAETRRIEAENRKAIEESEREAKERAQRDAAKLEKKGQPELAAVARAEPPPITPILQELPKNKNVSDKTTWVVDISQSPSEQWKLIKQLVEGGPMNMELLMLSPAGLKKLAAIRHEEMKTWPGITVRPVFTSIIGRDRKANG